MSMNGHAKRTIDALQALDFRKDEDASHQGVYVYWHPNAPEVKLRVFSGISDVAAAKVRIKAADIAGLSRAGESVPRTVGESARIKRAKARQGRAAAAERAAKELAPFQIVADERARLLANERRISQAEAHRRAIESLMRPGRGIA